MKSASTEVSVDSQFSARIGKSISSIIPRSIRCPLNNCKKRTSVSLTRPIVLLSILNIDLHNPAVVNEPATKSPGETANLQRNRGKTVSLESPPITHIALFSFEVRSKNLGLV